MGRKKALIIVDMINDFVHKNGALYVKDSESIIPYIKEKILEFKNENFPVFYANDNHFKYDEEFNLFPKHGVRGTWGAKVISDLEPSKEDIIIPKRRYSAFFGTDLDIYLREMDIKEVSIVGVVTHICVFYTAIFGRLLEYKISVLRNGVYDFDEKLHQIALSQLREVWGVEIV